ncbi:MAG: hypothetical protein Q8P46_07000 [Hyphomicrobiales bacterium]|nr:hypothetical protein [Hyphomicrobiales bacterium]
MTAPFFSKPTFDDLARQGEDEFGPSPKGSAGARTTFSEAFSTAYEDSIRNESMYGLEAAFEDIERAELDKIYERTGERLNPLRRDRFMALARMYQDEIPSAEDQTSIDEMGSRFARMAQIRREHPDIKSYDEMWGEVREKSQAAHERFGKAAALSGTAGTLGGFAGGMAGMFTPRRDPFNVATVAVGAGGVLKTLAARMAADAGINAGIEGLDQLLGVQENRKLLGLPNGPGEALMRIGFAGVGGATFRGAGETLMKGGRALAGKIKRGAPTIRAARVAQEAGEIRGEAPLGQSRVAKGIHNDELARTIARYDNGFEPPPTTLADLPSTVSRTALVSRDADAMFAGASPVALQDVLSKAAPGDPAIGRLVGKAGVRIEELNRKIEVADKQAADLRQEIETAKQAVDPAKNVEALRREVEAVAAQIDEVQANRKIGAQKRKQRVKALEAERAGLRATIGKAGAAETARARAAGAEQVASDLRAQRAQVIQNARQQVPAPVSRDIDRRQVMRDLRTPAQSEPSALQAIPDREYAEIMDEARKALDDQPPPTAERVLSPDGERELVDIGLDEPVDPNMELLMPLSDDPANPSFARMTVKDVLDDLADDDALVKQMKECLL